jgi:MoaA/NifB/PqqE/SkfB family radical SAM enzyme
LFGHRPKVREVGFNAWIRWFERFPYKIKEVYVSGGEPTLHKDFVRIVNYLLWKGYYVCVFTNLLKVDKILQIKPCARLAISATYHHKWPVENFNSNYLKIKDKYNVWVNEVEDKKLPYSKKIHQYTPEDIGQDLFIKVGLRVSPDLYINTNCYELITHTEKS